MAGKTPKKPKQTVSLAEMADWFGITERRVQQLAKEQVIKKDSRGQYDLYESVRGYIAFLKDEIDDTGVDPNIKDSLKKEKIRLTKARADLTEMEAKEKTGELISSEEVEANLIELFSNIRAYFLSIPTRLAPLIYEQDSIEAIKKITKEEIHKALKEISSAKIKITSSHKSS